MKATDDGIVTGLLVVPFAEAEPGRVVEDDVRSAVAAVEVVVRGVGEVGMRAEGGGVAADASLEEVGMCWREVCE